MGFEETLRSGSREAALASAESFLLPLYDRMKKVKVAFDNKIQDGVTKDQGPLEIGEAWQGLQATQSFSG